MSPWPFGELRVFGYDVVVVDPPWHFDLYSAKGEKKSARAHYETMPLQDIMRLPVGHLAAPDCLLLLWSCAPLLPQALAVMEAWGFTYASRISWRKVSRHGRPLMGPGYRVRTYHEDILLGTIGAPKHKAFPSLFSGVRREHSVKPSSFYEMVAAHTPGQRRADLFASQPDVPFTPRLGFEPWSRPQDRMQEAA